MFSRRARLSSSPASRSSLTFSSRATGKPKCSESQLRGTKWEWSNCSSIMFIFPPFSGTTDRQNVGPSRHAAHAAPRHFQDAGIVTVKNTGWKLIADQIGGALHEANVHPPDVFTNDPKGDKLGAREKDDNRGEEGKARDRTAHQQVVQEHIGQKHKPHEAGRESEDRGEAQGGRAEGGCHVQGVLHQLAKGVIGSTMTAWIVANRNGRESGGAPRQHGINRYIGAAVIEKGIAEMGAKGAKGANGTCRRDSQNGVQDSLGQDGRRISPPAVLLLNGDSVDDIPAPGEPIEQGRYFFGRVLEIIVHGDDDLVSRLADTAKQGVMLTIIAGQVDSAHFGVELGQRRDDFPTLIGTSVIDKKDLKCRGARLQHIANAGGQLRQARFPSINRDDDGYRLALHGPLRAIGLTISQQPGLSPLPAFARPVPSSTPDFPDRNRGCGDWLAIVLVPSALGYWILHKNL